MTTKTIEIQKNSVLLPSSWKNIQAYISIGKDMVIVKKTKPLDSRIIKAKLKIVGKNISQKTIKQAIKKFSF